jgi:hypothetical protein
LQRSRALRERVGQEARDQTSLRICPQSACPASDRIGAPRVKPLEGNASHRRKRESQASHRFLLAPTPLQPSRSAKLAARGIPIGTPTTLASHGRTRGTHIGVKNGRCGRRRAQAPRRGQWLASGIATLSPASCASRAPLRRAVIRAPACKGLRRRARRDPLPPRAGGQSACRCTA